MDVQCTSFSGRMSGPMDVLVRPKKGPLDVQCTYRLHSFGRPSDVQNGRTLDVHIGHMLDVHSRRTLDLSFVCTMDVRFVCTMDILHRCPLDVDFLFGFSVLIFFYQNTNNSFQIFIELANKAHFFKSLLFSFLSRLVLFIDIFSNSVLAISIE